MQDSTSAERTQDKLPSSSDQDSATSFIKKEQLRVHQTLVLLIWKILLLHTVLFLLLAMISGGLWFSSFFLLYTSEFATYFAGLAVEYVFFVLGVIFLLLDWKNRYYILDKERISFRSGIFRTRELHYELTRKIESETVEQGYLGKLLHYGTVKAYNPALKVNIYLKDIPDPQYYLDVIRALQLNEGSIKEVPSRDRILLETR
jgi:membrane protein YdbS with pleckstrin-like domain